MDKTTAQSWRYALVTGTPVVFLVLGVTVAPMFAFAAIVYLTIFSFAADELGTPPDVGQTQDAITRHLPTVLGVVHFALLAAVLIGLAGAQGLGERVLLFLSFGWFFGTVSMANAHELIHRQSRAQRALGKWVLISMLFGHHTSAHVLVHHVHVATPLDPNSAKKGRTLYRFFIDAWVGSFIQGMKAERRRAATRGRPGGLANPYVIYCLGAATVIAWVAALFGPAMALGYVALSFFSHGQLLVSDYVQHYGLRRQQDETGRYEPVSPMHSWNSPYWFTAALTLNAASHSDHHAHPMLTFTELHPATDGSAPVLPHSIPFMALIAMVPPWWFSVMDPRVAAWWDGQAGGRSPVSDGDSAAATPAA